MGNLVQLLFTCGNYFRYKDTELITDAHFGHFVPVAYLRLQNVFVTSSFNAKQRLGVSKIDELGKSKLSKEEHEALLQVYKRAESKLQEDESESKTESDDSAVGEEKKERLFSKKFRHCKSKVEFFEKGISLEEKGSWKVQQTTFRVLPHRSVNIQLHAINDSKPVYRISSKYAALPLVELNVTRKNPENFRKEKVSVKTTLAHKYFRKKMGFNDQSDSKRSRIGLSAKYFKRQPQKLVAKTLEDAVINAYCNYLLDPGCLDESWPTFVYNLVQEFIDSGANMRERRKEPNKFKSIHDRGIKRPRADSDLVRNRGLNCPGANMFEKLKEVPTSSRTRQCAFCERRHASHKCRACNMHLCVKTPKPNNGRTYSSNGPCCFLRYHGISSFPKG